MGAAPSKSTVKRELKELKSALDKKNLWDLVEELNEEMKLLESTTLDIAITGESGAGKSSLVNALRGMDDSEEGAAETGNTETTMDLKKYEHPTFPKVAMWDLPGIGTPTFQAKEYLKMTCFAEYDFFIIVGAERFTEHHVLLAKEIQKMEKNYYYVRSKVDQSIDADKRKMKSNFNEEETLGKIREYCCRNLREAGDLVPRVFLLSSWDLSTYDFPLLLSTLEKELGGLKRQVLIESLPAFSKEVLEKKKAAMEALIWKITIVSCTIGTIPVSGLCLAFNISILVSTMVKFCHVFGLDEACLGRLAKLFGKPVAELKSAIKKVPLADEITEEFVLDLAIKAGACRELMAVEIALEFIPVLGTLVGGGNSFATTFYVLKSFLSDVMEDAANVRAKAAE